MNQHKKRTSRTRENEDRRRSLRDVETDNKDLWCMRIRISSSSTAYPTKLKKASCHSQRVRKDIDIYIIHHPEMMNCDHPGLTASSISTDASTSNTSKTVSISLLFDNDNTIHRTPNRVYKSQWKQSWSHLILNLQLLLILLSNKLHEFPWCSTACSLLLHINQVVAQRDACVQRLYPQNGLLVWDSWLELQRRETTTGIGTRLQYEGESLELFRRNGNWENKQKSVIAHVPLCVSRSNFCRWDAQWLIAGVFSVLTSLSCFTAARLILRYAPSSSLPLICEISRSSWLLQARVSPWSRK